MCNIFGNIADLVFYICCILPASKDFIEDRSIYNTVNTVMINSFSDVTHITCVIFVSK